MIASTENSGAEISATKATVMVPEPSLDKNIPRNIDHLYQLIVHYAKSMGRRPRDFFKDFDPLRSGYISTAQFERGISGLLDKGPVFSVAEITDIRKEYENNSNKLGRVEYNKFLDKLDEISNVIGSKGKFKKIGGATSSNPFKHVRLSGEEMERLHLLFFKLSSWVRYHGASLKSWFKDFDRHHNGLVTQDQFHRSLPTHLLSEDETALLFQAFHDKTTNMFHYVRLNTSLSHFSKENKHHDIDKSVVGASKYNHPSLGRQAPAHHVPIGTENLLLANEEYVEEDNISIDHLIEKVKKVVYKRRIRLSEFCRDFDLLNRGLISVKQFEAAMHMSGLDLTQKEMDVLFAKYGVDSREINYRSFCHEVDSIFTIPNLERNPTSTPALPPKDFLNQTNHKLNPEEERQFISIIKNLRRQIEIRNLSVGGYFLDFDKGQGNTGRITKSHLSRILSMIPLKVSEDDLFILFRKYEDHCGDVIYHDFVKLLESTDDPFDHAPPGNQTDLSDDEDNYAPKSTQEEILERVLKQIEHFVVKNSIRVEEFFRDADQLRLASIRHEEFIKGISRMGFPLNEDEANTLCQAFQDPKRPECSLWKKFAAIVDKVPGHLESNPEWRQSPKSDSRNDELNSKSGAVIKCQKVLLKKPVLLKPFFRDFDKTGSGHVTFVQANQCFTYGRLELSPSETEELLQLYGNKEMRTFDYLAFLRNVERPLASLNNKKQQTILTEDQPRIEPKPNAITLTQNPQEGNVDRLLFRLKSLIKTERFRYFEHFMRDLDPLNHGTLSVSDFSRSLSAFPLPLTAKDMELLAKRYASTSNPQRVDYRNFCKEMESVFTLPEWEKFPTRGDVNFVPSLRDEPYVLNRKEQEICEKAMTRLATQLYQRRMDIYYSFEDYDKLHNGTIPSSHFKSVLTNHNLLLYFDQGEDCVMKRFRIHQKPDSWIDYGKFCEVLGSMVEKMENGDAE